MTVSETLTPEWKPVPGFGSYEASHRGLVRSVDRQLADGRRRKGVVLKTRPSTRGYPQADLIDDDGRKQTRTIHSLVMLAHVGEPPPGQECRHLNDDPNDNRWPENLAYGTPPENVADRMANSPAAPKPLKVCARCGESFTGNGRRCHGCVEAIGVEAAQRLAAGEDPDQVALALDYPSTVGIWRLAAKYGGARVVIGDPAERRPSWLQRVMVAVRDWLADGDPE